MIQSLFHTSLPWLEFVIRAIAVFLFVLLMLRMAGKRQLAQMSPTEFVALLLISNAVQNSMNGGDNSMTGGFILAAVLITCSTVISYLTYKSKFMSRVFEGVPVLLIHNGKIIEKNLNRERITHNELKAMLWRSNVYDLLQVKDAVLETDGELAILLKDVHSDLKAQIESK